MEAKGLTVQTICQDGYADMRWINSHGGDWEAYPESLLHGKFAADVRALVAGRTVQVVVAEGYQIFHDPGLCEDMQVAAWLDIDEGTCKARRKATKPVPKGYFRRFIWPNYLRYREARLPVMEAQGQLHLFDMARPVVPSITHVQQSDAKKFVTENVVPKLVHAVMQAR